MNYKDQLLFEKAYKNVKLNEAVGGTVCIAYGKSQRNGFEVYGVFPNKAMAQRAYTDQDESGYSYDDSEDMPVQFVEVPFGVVSFDPILSATKHPEHSSRD